MKLVKTAYSIDFSKIEEGYLYNDEICFAENRNKAKVLLLETIKYSSVCLIGEDDDVTYINIPVRRCKDCDRYLFEGQELTQFQIEDLKYERKRLLELDDILNDDKIKYCYIIKGGVYYRPNYSGYTDFKHNAGIYLKKDAIDSAKHSKEIRIEEIVIDVHNKMIVDKILLLSDSIIAL